MDLILQETFPGAVDDPWSTDRWVKDHLGAGADNQDGAGRGRLEYGLGSPSVARVQAIHDAVSLHRVEIDGLQFTGGGGVSRLFALASNDWAGNLEPTSGYSVQFGTGGFTADLRRIDSGVATTLASFNRHGATGTTDSAFNLIFEVADDGGTQRVRVKTWLTTDGEPGTWDADVEDATYTSGVYQESLERLSSQRSAWRDEMRIYDLAAVESFDPADTAISGGELTWTASDTAGVTAYDVHFRDTETGEDFDPTDHSTRVTRLAGQATSSYDGSEGGGTGDWQCFGVIPPS